MAPMCHVRGTFTRSILAKLDEPVRKKTRNIRFGGLEPRVIAAAAAGGLTVSAWIRRVVERALSDRAASEQPLPPTSRHTECEDKNVHKGRRRCVLRLPATDFARWRNEALEHDLALTRYIELQMSVTPARNHRIAAAMEVARRATIELAAVGRNLNQLARSWNTYPGQSTARERALLAKHCSDVERFSTQLSHFIAELNTKQGPRPRRLA